MKIVFTSCMDAERVPRQPIWDRVRHHEQPDLLLLLGDQIYMDWGLFGTPWRERILRNPAEGLANFAKEMHRRYALQWGVESFRALIGSLTNRASPHGLLLTWDDHDFAWNNALGVQGPEADRHDVPPEVKAVSWQLFQQFERQLRTAALSDPYPPLPDLTAGAAPPASGLFREVSLGANWPELLLLDTRWSRTARALGAPLLDETQRTRLLQRAGEGSAGLLLVAGGSPMAHGYVGSQDDWSNNGAGLYREYAELTRAARRPVLFLGGDVHHNVYSGRLPTLGGGPSRVVQLLASGAAVGRWAFKKFAPSYGALTLDGTARAGSIRVQLRTLASDGAWVESPAVTPMRFDSADWTALQTESAAARWPVDTEPLTALFARTRRNKNWRSAVRDGLRDLQGLDDAYGDNAADPQPGAGDLPPATPAMRPDSLRIESAGPDVIRLHPTDASVGEDPRQTVERALRDVYERALSAGRRSVVLFVHGVAKSPAQAVAQALALREAYADAEPVVFSWPAGRSGGWLDALASVQAAREGAYAAAPALDTTLQALASLAAEPSYAGLSTVVLARSAGSLLLDAALRRFSAAGRRAELMALRRIVLSAPLIESRAFAHPHGFGGAGLPPVYVTLNLHDATLAKGDWIDGFGHPLGVQAAPVVCESNPCWLDFSAADGVGDRHDYLLPEISEAQRGVHAALLCAATFNPSDMVAKDWLNPRAEGGFDVS
ncbi:MAG: alpha/beta hydrolase [Pseudomonadota bacterium]